MTRAEDTIPPAARWLAAALLAALGVAGVVHSLLTPRPVPLQPAPPAFAAATQPDNPDPPTALTDGNLAGGHAAETAGRALQPAAPASPTARRVNINTATAAELDLLPGIGPALAGRILDYRASHGPFSTLDDLDGVSGIGPKTIAKLVPYATAQ